MYAITGITGKVGGAMAEALLDAGLRVRAILRDPAKAAEWKARGCDIAIAAMEDADALAAAFSGAEGVFILPPSDFDPEPGYPAARVTSFILAPTSSSPASEAIFLSMYCSR